MEYQPFLDSEDTRYVVSFPITDLNGAKEFFDMYGFVVWRDIFSKEECQLSRSAMWRILQESYPCLQEEDPSSWNRFKSSGKYGLSSRGPTFDPTLVNNRQNANLASAIATLIETDIADVMTSHDRYTIYRATDLQEHGLDGTQFRTGRANIHIDLNPWWYYESSPDVLFGLEQLQYNDPQDFVKENNLVVESMGCHVQCILNFSDNLNEDGGTLVVPRFHKLARDWCTTNRNLRKPLPWVQFASDRDGNPMNVEQNLLDAAIRVSMRAGSVLMWNQIMAHGTSPNHSKKCRTAQFLKGFSRRKSFQDGRNGSSNCHSAMEADADFTKSMDDAIITRCNDAHDVSMPCVGMEAGISNPNDLIKTDHPCRLFRRSFHLKQQLIMHNAFDSVTALGETLFGIDSIRSD